MISRDAELTVVSPFGTHSANSEFELSSSNSGRMSNTLNINGVRHVMSGRYGSGSGEFSLNTPYIRYGEIKAIEVKFNHADSRADATVTWAPSKAVRLRCSDFYKINDDYLFTFINP